jgi:hypothetical protein
MLLQFPCGDCVRCNGLLGGAFSRRSCPDPAPNAVVPPSPLSRRSPRPSTEMGSSLSPRCLSAMCLPFHALPILRQPFTTTDPIRSIFPCLFGAKSRSPTTTAQRLAVQRRARRTNGSLMLLQCPCGGIVRCNGLFDGRTTNPRNFSDQADPITHTNAVIPRPQSRRPSRLPIASPHHRADGRCP